MGTLSREATLSFSRSLPFPVWVNSSRKEFAPIGANSFLEELTPFMKAFVLQGNSQKNTEVGLFCKIVGKDNVYIHTSKNKTEFASLNAVQLYREKVF